MVKAYLFLCSRLDQTLTNCDNCATVSTSGLASLPVSMGLAVNGPVKTEIELTDIESLDGDDPVEMNSSAPLYRTQNLVNTATFFTGNPQRPKSMDAAPPSTEPFDNQSLIASGLSNLLTNDKIAKMMKRAIGSNPATTFPPKRKRDDRQLAPGK